MAGRIYMEQVQKDNKGVKKYSFTKRQIIVTTVIAVISLSVLTLWTNLKITSVKSDHLRKEQSLKREAYAQLENTYKEFLKIISKPYVWAIKSAMKQDNVYEIDLYGNSIAQSGNSISVMVVNGKGTVISATNEQYEGKYFISFASPYYLQVDHTIVYEAVEGVLTMASPIMDGENKLGTLIIHYSTADPKLFLSQ